MVCLRPLLIFLILGHLIRVTASNRTELDSVSTNNFTVILEETCDGQCGRQMKSRCSCDEMCFKDSSCCPDFLSKCVEKMSKLHQTYVSPEFICTDTRIVIISNCVNNIKLTKEAGWLPPLKLIDNKENLFEMTDKTHLFPVADLTTGYAFVNWDIFMCFAHHYSKPIILKAFIKHVTIQKMNSFIYTHLLYEDFRFDFPKPTQALLSTCGQFSEDVFSSNVFKGNTSMNESHYVDCAKCSGQLNSAQGDLGYPISITPKMNNLYLKSEEKSTMWSELLCKFDFEKQPLLILSDPLLCVVVNYTSSLIKTSDDYRHKLAVTKLAFNVKYDINLGAETFGHILRCFLRDYTNINILNTWQSPLFVKSNVVDQTLFIIKILMYEYIEERPVSLSGIGNIRDSISKFIHLLHQDNMRIYFQGLTEKSSKDRFESNEGSKKRSKKGSKAKDVKRVRDELPELDEKEFLPLLTKRESDVVCACSTTLKEIFTAKYLDTWICPLQCKLVKSSDNISNTDNLMKIVRTCSDIKTFSGTRDAHSVQLWFRFLITVFINQYILMINLIDNL